MSRPRPTRACPVCGQRQLLSCLASHVGSARCLATLQFRLRGVPHDPVRGPRVLELARELDEVLRQPDTAPPPP